MGTMNIVVDVSAMQVETLTITVLAREGRSMAPKLVTKKALPAKAPTPAKKALPAKAPTPAKKAAPAMAKSTAKKASAAPKASKIGPSRSRLPAATVRALKELETGELTRYVDEDDLFKKLGIKLGKD
jgi:hypothetical protein